MPTLRKLLLELRDAIQFDGCRETLRQIFLNMGYEFTKNVEERTVLMERDEVAAWRHRNIRKILAFRKEPIESRKSNVYIDETYVNFKLQAKEKLARTIYL